MAQISKKKQSYYDSVSRWSSQTLERVSRVFVILMFALHPLMFGPNGYGDLTETKLKSFAVCLVLFAVISLAVLIFYKSQVPGERAISPRSVKSYEWAILVFWLAMVLAALFSGRFYSALLGTTARNEGVLVWSAYIATFVLVSRFYKPSVTDILVFCGVAALVAIYGFCQYYGYDFIPLLPPGYEYMVGPRLSHVSTMSNIDVVSTYMCAAFCLSLVIFAQGKKRLHWVFLPLGWIAFYSLMLNDVLSGYVGLLAVFALLLPFIARERKSAGRFLLMLAGCPFLLWLKYITLLNAANWKNWLPGEFEQLEPSITAPVAGLEPIANYLLIAAFVMLVAALVLLLVRLPSVPRKWYLCGWYGLVVIAAIAVVAVLPGLAERSGNETLLDAAGILRGELSDSFGSTRGYTWKKAFELFKERPVFGFGADGFFEAFHARFGSDSMERYAVTFDKAHNEYLQVLVDSGIFAAGGMIAFFSLILWKARKLFDAPLTLALAVTLVCYAVQAFFNISTPFATPIIWTLWGVLGAILRQSYKKGDA
jgi:O-antigen ligase